MKHLFLLPTLFYVCFGSLLAQSNMRVIRANSASVDIKEGKELQKNAWNISPDLKPDVYVTNDPNAHVTFYTDVESISFHVKPGKVFDFIILLNGKDSAWTQVKYAPTYPDILKKAGKYNYADTRPVPEFQYQSKDDPHLVELHQGFNLDSIAGSGNEVSKMINLLHWVHNLIPHDGQHNNPTVKNAMSMIAECKAGNRGLNCRGLATVLNECYLSMGFKSRFVTCMPKDSVFDDCHVINMVYSNELKKWLWMDPTNDAYLMDEKGTLLSIEEVRARLIADKTLIVNPDANWNHKSSTVKENYLGYYMSKNLYRLACPLVSEYDAETSFKGKKVVYVELLPLDGYQQTPQQSEQYFEKSGVTFVNYKTNNPALFWAAPK